MSFDSVKSNLGYVWNQIMPGSAASSAERPHIHYHIHCREVNFLCPSSSDSLGNAVFETRPVSAGRFKEISCYVLVILGALMTFLSTAAIGAQLAGIHLYYLPSSVSSLFVPGLSTLLTGLQIPGTEAKSISDFHKFFCLVQRSVEDVKV